MMTVAVTSNPDPDERWHFIFHSVCHDYRLITHFIEIAPQVWERISEVIHDIVEAITKVCNIFVESLRDILPVLEEVVTVTASSPQSPQSFPQRRKPRPARKNYLRLNTIGYCPRVIPCARSRC